MATDSQLLATLHRFVTGEYRDGLIPQLNMCDEQPWKTFSSHSVANNGGYFFCLRQKNGKKRCLRRPCWYVTEQRPVLSGQSVLGVKRNLVYRNRTEPEQDSRWFLKEYCLAEHVIGQLQEQRRLVPERKEFVLCRLKRKRTRRQKDNSEDD